MSPDIIKCVALLCKLRVLFLRSCGLCEEKNDYKQLLDEGFVISGIIKVEVSDLSTEAEG